jgi:mRNA interferase YafQ
MLKIVATPQYERDLKKIKKRGLPKKELDEVIKQLAEDKPLPIKNQDHKLKGNFSNLRECHIRPNWLLVYKKDKEILTLVLIGTGTHSDIFG